MKEILNIMLEYIISYALVFLLYYLLFIRKKTKYNKNKVPVEYYYVISLYGLKEKDIDYKKFMYMTLFVIYSFQNLIFLLEIIHLVIMSNNISCFQTSICRRNDTSLSRQTGSQTSMVILQIS